MATATPLQMRRRCDRDRFELGVVVTFLSNGLLKNTWGYVSDTVG